MHPGPLFKFFFTRAANLYLICCMINSRSYMRSPCTKECYKLPFSDGSWKHFLWFEHKCDFISHHLRGTWNPWMTIFVILSEKILMPVWFYMKLLKLCETGVSRKSWRRTEVKRDSVKCRILLSSMNSLWAWIHWPITTAIHLNSCQQSNRYFIK